MANTKRFPGGQTGNTPSDGSTAKAIGSAAVLVLALTSSFLTLQAADRQNPDSADAKRAEKPTVNQSSKPRPAKVAAHLSQSRKRPRPVNAAEPQAILNSPAASDVAALKELLTKQQEQLAAQQQQIAELRQAIEEQKHVTEARGQSRTPQAPNLGQVASLVPLIPAVAPAVARADAVAAPVSLRTLDSAPAAQEEIKSYTRKVDELGKSVEGVNKGLAGFKFGGTFRLRTDAILRSGNKVAGPVQNIRERYRLRFNLDKNLNDQFSFHVQLGSGRFDNQITDDTDFAGVAARGPLFLSEAWASWHPTRNVQVQAGRQREVFDDTVRFMWDDDLRFNGAHEIVGTDLSNNALGIRHFQLKAGQYILTNPNVTVLPSAAACTPPKPQVITALPATITPPPTVPANCAYLAAGLTPGGKVRDANLFDQGFQLTGDIKEGWSHYLFGNVELYRNANEIQLASTTGGLPLLVNNYFGLNLNGPFGGTGNGTTTPGGAIYTASRFQVGRLGYRITHNGWKVGNREVPVSVDVQLARNFGGSFLRNAWIGTLIAGDVKRTGDMRFLYAYAFKGANSMISQFTDDHLGTLTGVNLRTHLIRVDLGLTRFLQWQNFLYIQDEVSSNDPKRNFFVPIQAGAATTYRAQSEFLVTF